MFRFLILAAQPILTICQYGILVLLLPTQQCFVLQECFLLSLALIPIRRSFICWKVVPNFLQRPSHYSHRPTFVWWNLIGHLNKTLKHGWVLFGSLYPEYPDYMGRNRSLSSSNLDIQAWSSRSRRDLKKSAECYQNKVGQLELKQSFKEMVEILGRYF